MVTTYFPGSRSGALKYPLLSGGGLTVNPVAELTMLMVAPGTTASEESSTVPAIEPCVVDCAFREMELTHAARMRSARQRTPRRSELNVITALQNSCLRLTRSRVNYCVAAGALNQSHGQRAGRGEDLIRVRYFLKIGAQLIDPARVSRQ